MYYFWLLSLWVIISVIISGCGSKEAASTATPVNHSVVSTTSEPLLPKYSREYSGSPVVKFLAVIDDKSRQFESFLRKYETGICPPSTFNSNGKRYLLQSRPFTFGSQTALYRTVSNPSLVVKIQDPPTFHILHALWREHAASVALGPSEYFTAFYNVDLPETTSSFCENRMAVMSDGGEKSLINLIQEGGSPVEVVRLVARRALAILEAVHAVGLVHGDVHLNNFVFDDIETLKLIDFGRSTNWMDPVTNQHLTMEAAREKEERDETDYANYPERLNPFILSPFEIMGNPRSRRDDLFRLAESLIILLNGHDQDFELARCGRLIARAKMDPNFSSKVPKEFKDFYRYTVGLDFDQTPDYQILSQLFDV